MVLNIDIPPTFVSAGEKKASASYQGKLDGVGPGEAR